jgi:hypothetical protein
LRVFGEEQLVKRRFGRHDERSIFGHVLEDRKGDEERQKELKQEERRELVLFPSRRHGRVVVHCSLFIAAFVTTFLNFLRDITKTRARIRIYAKTFQISS